MYITTMIACLSAQKLTFKEVARCQNKCRLIRTPWVGIWPGYFLSYLAHAFTTYSICEITCLSTRWVRSLNIVHGLIRIEKKSLKRNTLESQDLTPGLLGENCEGYLCAILSLLASFSSRAYEVKSLKKAHRQYLGCKHISNNG